MVRFCVDQQAYEVEATAASVSSTGSCTLQPFHCSVDAMTAFSRPFSLRLCSNVSMCSAAPAPTVTPALFHCALLQCLHTLLDPISVVPENAKIKLEAAVNGSISGDVFAGHFDYSDDYDNSSCSGDYQRPV